jgi:hypothetical protein
MSSMEEGMRVARPYRFFKEDEFKRAKGVSHDT